MRDNYAHMRMCEGGGGFYDVETASDKGMGNGKVMERRRVCNAVVEESEDGGEERLIKRMRERTQRGEKAA
jgi:hypothetical protein